MFSALHNITNIVRYNLKAKQEMYCDAATKFFTDVMAGTYVEEEGKGRGFLPSLQLTEEKEARKRVGAQKETKERKI